ncbi:MAG: PAS domain S-box protein [Gammaproteobacteria bacterium]|nr:PAS domain S-box protein [Gammaproteobacteria bacterium]MBU1977867.1 PAS domain S-box protein [Gammaproteobacteria bacterium]
MQEPTFPANEARRLEVLRALCILDTPPEERFDRITRVAQHLFDVPFALISLVDADRQWFKSCQGLSATETPRSISFCGHAILSENTFVVANALDDPRFADNPLVTDAPHIRFYAGHPLKAGDGSRLGTLCIIDSKPRDFSAEILALLADLARSVELELNQQTLVEATVSIDAGHQQLQAVLESVVDGIITIDDHGIMVSFNRAAGQIFGYSADEVIGRNIKMLMPEPYHGEHDGYLHNFRSSGVKKIIGIGREVSGKRKDGSIFPMDLAVSEMWIGQKRMFTGIVRDITERNLAIQARRDDEARLAAILDNVLDGIITIGERGNIGSFNKAAEKIFGYAAAEVIGNNVKMLMPEPYHSEHDGYLHNYVSTGKKKIIGIGRQVVGRRKDGSTFPMDLAVSAMQLVDKRMFTGIVRDITERVKVEQMKSEFISTVSHELRTPLTSIRGSLGLIVGGVVGELPPQAKAMVDIAHKNSERLIMLVNDILDIEKIESGNMQFDMKPLELVPLIEQALEVNRAYGDQFNVGFVLENPQRAVSVNADAGRLMQVMANLLSNAAKFSSTGATVNVSVECAEKGVRISVADHGLGIPDEFRGKIFQKFSQADSSDTRKKGGTGLGLSITKAIIEQMGGEIGFESERGVGTTFFIDLPEWREQSGLGLQDNVKKLNRILICEDDRDTARLLQMMLKQGGFDSDIAYSAEEALDLLSRVQYRAITLDVMLPGQDGISLIHDLRANEATRDIPVIVVSATGGLSGNYLESGCVVLDWLQKPIDETRLMNVLQRISQQGGNKPVILHVEDDPDIRQVLSALVGNEAELVSAPTLTDAKACLGIERFDLIILDIGLPDGSGLDLLPFLNEKGLAIPVLIFSAEESSDEISRQVASALIKARTSNEVLLTTIKRLIGKT